MKNKEKYDLTKIITTKTEEQGRKVIKIYDCSDEENKILIDTVDRGAGVPRNQIFAKWAEKEYKEPKFKVGDYVISKTRGFRRIDIVDVGNQELPYRLEGLGWYAESELQPSPLDKSEHDFLQDMVDYINPKIESFMKSNALFEDECFISYRTCDGGTGYFNSFLKSEMYTGMKIDKPYTLEELGLTSKEVKQAKKKFRLEDYTEENVGMHCNTEEYAKTFCNFLDKNGKTFRNGENYELDTRWDIYENRTVYMFNRGMINATNYNAKYDHYTILEFDDFDWSDVK
jgi:hypothetical protein